MQAIFVTKTQLSPRAWTFYFKPGGYYRYIAGQFCELTLLNINSKADASRWFTLSSAPHENLVAITTDLSPPLSAFKQGLSSLKAGDKVTLSLAQGDFILPKLTSIPIIGLSSGIGCTPFRSMVIDNNYHKKKHDIRLFLRFSSEQDVIFGTDFSLLGSNYHAYYAKDIQYDSILDEQQADLSSSYFYISGSDSFVNVTKNALLEHTIPNKHIFTDHFIGL